MQEYNKTDQKIHYLSQVLAKLNRTFIPNKEDDSHTNLYFDPLSHRIFGRWMDTKNSKIISALNLENFTFELINDEREVLKVVDIDGYRVDDIEQTIDRTLPEVGLKGNGFRDDLHYEIPNYGFTNKPVDRWTRKEIEDWETIRELANSSSYLLLGTLQSESEVRIWPHHFDTGIYTEPNSAIGLGFGLAMKDQMAGSAYFYFAGYSLDDSTINYDNRTELKFGQWEIHENWKGAILPISDLSENRKESILNFIREVTEFYLSC